MDRSCIGLVARSALRIGSFFVCVVAFCAEPTTGILRLKNGDELSGSFADSQRGDKVRWQHPHFASPFEFAKSSIVGTAFANEKMDLPAVGDFCIELAAGDRIFGSIAAINENTITVESQDLGELVVSRSSIHRLIRWDNGAAVSFIGPGKLDDWNIPGDENAWDQRGGRISSSGFNARASRNVTVSFHSRIELEIYWDAKPNFLVAFGVNENNVRGISDDAFRIEVWDDEIVAVWEYKDVADVAVLGSVAQMSGKLALSIDQTSRRAVIRTLQGETLAELEIRSNEMPAFRQGIWLQNISGNLQLGSIQVTRLDDVEEDDEPVDQDQSVDTFHMAGNEVLTGHWTAVGDEVWVLTDEETEHQVDSAKVQSVDFAKSSAEADRGQMQIATHSGFRLTGSIATVSDGVIGFHCDALQENISIPVSHVRSIDMIGASVVRPRENQPYVARLETADTRLHGRLADTDDSASLTFQPIDATAAVMLPSLSGRLVYRDPAPPPKKTSASQRQRQRVVAPPAGIWGAVTRAFGSQTPTKKVSPKSLYLRSGEIIPCEISAIDETGVTFASEMTSVTRLPHDQVLAAQLLSGTSEPTIDAIQRERLLTVPRNRKKNPPTHLIVARTGDVMRGKLVGLNDDGIQFESRLETILVERSVVSQILWLNTDSLAGFTETEPTETTSAFNRVQAILEGGNRLSLKPKGVSDNHLIGENNLLGQCQIAIVDIDQLLIGKNVELESAKNPYGNWKLSDAPEPILLDDVEGGMSPGTASGLVGSEAPDFSLDLLDGKRFTLSQHKGKVVVLDFWATWCGPCLQAMPVIDEAVAEFDRDDVQLVAVNLQETAEPIRQTLDRLNIRPIVALDIDGVAAARYQADAIPQTVIIDREGKVARLFVGGGSKLGEQVREAIRECLAVPAN